MSYLLLLETSGKNCSVALADESGILTTRSASAEHFIHAEQLHVMINEIFTERNLSWNSLSAVAVSKGPGSYTGLRIGVSAAKGFCFSLHIPLIAIDTTELLALAASKVYTDAQIILPMIDARRMEVYAARFDGHAKRLSTDEAIVLDENTFIGFAPEYLVLTGDGAEKCQPLVDSRVRILPLLPNAEMMHALAMQAFNQKRFEDVAYFEPFYLKDYTPGTSRKSVL
jgi:tRNA threonylcarbamoyladenosine biosynthesis protein TsaB